MPDARAAGTEVVFTSAGRIGAGDFDGLAVVFSAAVVTAEGNSGWVPGELRSS